MNSDGSIADLEGRVDPSIDSPSSRPYPNEATLRADIDRLDTLGFEVVTALAHLGGPPSDSHSSPHRFACSDGRIYWVKAASQNGLTVELIAGRLAHVLGVGQGAVVVQVPKEALPIDGSLARLHGTLVGIADRTQTVNARDLAPFLGDGRLEPTSIDRGSRASVIAFQTWIGVTDEQVLVRLTDGRVFSIDHGACLPPAGSSFGPVVAPIPGVSNDLGRDWNLLRPTVDAINAFSEAEILEYVARVPDDVGWHGDIITRTRIAEGLLDRRTKLEEVLKAWAPPLP